MMSLILLLIYQKKAFCLFASHISHPKAGLTQHEIFDKIRLTMKCTHVSELNLSLKLSLVVVVPCACDYDQRNAELHLIPLF